MFSALLIATVGSMVPIGQDVTARVGMRPAGFAAFEVTYTLSKRVSLSAAIDQMTYVGFVDELDGCSAEKLNVYPYFYEDPYSFRARRPAGNRIDLEPCNTHN